MAFSTWRLHRDILSPADIERSFPSPAPTPTHNKNSNMASCDLQPDRELSATPHPHPLSRACFGNTHVACS